VLREDAAAAYLLSPKLHIALHPRVQNFEYNPFDTYLINHSLALS
jgi:hypothetical protein